MQVEEKTLHIWVTQYALTQGIFECEAMTCLTSDPTGKMVKKVGGTYMEIFHKPHWHETREAAVARAEEMRKNKISSLKKSITKMEALKFT
jgi:hypothetical protein